MERRVWTVRCVLWISTTSSRIWPSPAVFAVLLPMGALAAAAHEVGHAQHFAERTWRCRLRPVFWPVCGAVPALGLIYPILCFVGVLRFSETVFGAGVSCGVRLGHGSALADDVIAWLRELEKTHPFVLTACGHDFLTVRLLVPITDAAPLAKRMVDFCPDLLDGDLLDSPEVLAQELAGSQGCVSGGIDRGRP